MVVKTRSQTYTYLQSQASRNGRSSVASTKRSSNVAQRNIQTSAETRSVIEMVPLEIWEDIVQGMCPSQLVEISRVSRHLNTVVKRLTVWHTISTTANLGPLKSRGKRKTYYGLVMASRCRICEGCFKFCKRFRAYDMPLPVFSNRHSRLIQLCLDCRCAYFKEHPEQDDTAAHLFCRRIYGGQVGVEAQNDYIRSIERRRLERERTQTDNESRSVET